MANEVQEVKVIGPFVGEYRFLSNYSPHPAKYDGYVYPTAEHAFQASKTMSAIQRERIAQARTPGQAKGIGRVVALREGWDMIKVEIMRQIVLDKFTRNHQLIEPLIDTYPHVLVEINTWNDRIWGVCNGVGDNLLGMCLMNVREVLMRRYGLI